MYPNNSYLPGSGYPAGYSVGGGWGAPGPAPMPSYPSGGYVNPPYGQPMGPPPGAYTPPNLPNSYGASAGCGMPSLPLGFGGFPEPNNVAPPPPYGAWPQPTGGSGGYPVQPPLGAYPTGQLGPPAGGGYPVGPGGYSVAPNNSYPSPAPTGFPVPSGGYPGPAPQGPYPMASMPSQPSAPPPTGASAPPPPPSQPSYHGQGHNSTASSDPAHVSNAKHSESFSKKSVVIERPYLDKPSEPSPRSRSKSPPAPSKSISGGSSTRTGSIGAGSTSNPTVNDDKLAAFRDLMTDVDLDDKKMRQLRDQFADK